MVVIDRRDINNLKVMVSYDVPNFDGFRGKIVGNTLYIAGIGGGLAVVDLTNPLSPVLRTPPAQPALGVTLRPPSRAPGGR